MLLALIKFHYIVRTLLQQNSWRLDGSINFRAVKYYNNIYARSKLYVPYSRGVLNFQTTLIDNYIQLAQLLAQKIIFCFHYFSSFCYFCNNAKLSSTINHLNQYPLVVLAIKGWIV